MRRKVCSSAVSSSILHGSETWQITKELERTLERAEMRMVRWMCGKRLRDRVPSSEVRDRLGIESISTVLQRNRLRWFGHVQRKLDDDWTKRCLEYPKLCEPNCRGGPKMTWMEVINRDLRELGLCKQDAADRVRWRRLIGPVDRDSLAGR